MVRVVFVSMAYVCSSDSSSSPVRITQKTFSAALLVLSIQKFLSAKNHLRSLLQLPCYGVERLIVL